MPSRDLNPVEGVSTSCENGQTLIKAAFTVGENCLKSFSVGVIFLFAGQYCLSEH